MNFKELKEKILANDEIYKNDIKVRPYLPFVQKQLMIEDLIDSCIDENVRNLKKINYAYKQLNTDMQILLNYADIELDSEINITEQYDFLKEHGIFNYIIEQMNSNEYVELFDLIDKEFNQVLKIDNSVENILSNLTLSISKFLNDILLKIPDEKGLKKIVSEIKKFNPESVSKVKELMEFVKGSN